MVFVTAEFGVNWNADFNILRSRAKKCKDLGVDAIKLQCISGEFIQTHKELPWYRNASVNEENIEEIDKICKQIGIEWYSSALYPRIQKGGILILDDYGIFLGETKAVDEYFSDIEVEIKKLPFAMSPCYMVI